MQSKKGIRSVQWGLEQSPRSWGTFENFVLKVTLQSVRLVLTVSYRKMGSRINFVGVGGPVAPPASL